MSPASQNARILEHLKQRRTLTPLDALRQFGCLRLSGRIYDLRQNGHQIDRRMVEVAGGKHVAEYRLVKLAGRAA